jgi:hypothetical protein
VISLFRDKPVPFAKADKTIKTLASRLAPAVQYFVERRLASSDPTFTTAQLLHYVRDAVGHVAPGSPERILRMLRQAGKLNYKVVNRKRGEYEATEVPIYYKPPFAIHPNIEIGKWIVEVNTGDGWSPSINTGLKEKVFSTEIEANEAADKYGTKKSLLGLKYRVVKQ